MFDHNLCLIHVSCLLHGLFFILSGHRVLFFSVHPHLLHKIYGFILLINVFAFTCRCLHKEMGPTGRGRAHTGPGSVREQCVFVCG